MPRPRGRRLDAKIGVDLLTLVVNGAAAVAAVHQAAAVDQFLASPFNQCTSHRCQLPFTLDFTSFTRCDRVSLKCLGNGGLFNGDSRIFFRSETISSSFYNPKVASGRLVHLLAIIGLNVSL